MTIRNVEDFVRGLFDWKLLRGCFGKTYIEPTDVDGLVERHNHFLIFEGKGPGGSWKQGQNIALAALQHPKSFTVIKFRGEPPDGPIIEMEVIGPHRNTNGLIPTTTEAFRQEVLDWFEWANNA